MTDYRFGAKPVFSFETHGKMDTVFAASSWMLPLLFGFKDTAAAKIFEGNSLVEACVVAATDWSSERAHRGASGRLDRAEREASTAYKGNKKRSTYGNFRVWYKASAQR
ncbi:hypothetical protein [Terriglobus roseus]|uniref:Uncharacterized protein n=1 Tax=Terriglobus roseus TaxID=392734 RepID=A0A1G7HJL4_9BACT|nr:hypothetical protein [Terriglobus roseus]SDF00563.1 hypothetical protein SAMN05444167_1100 [Terriglobus roseus]